MALRGWMTRPELDSLRYWHARGLHDTAIAEKLGRTDSCISQHRRGMGLPSNYTPEIRSQHSAERMRALSADPEFIEKRDAARPTQSELQLDATEKREAALSKIPDDDPLLQALRHVHGPDGQARRKREARA